MPRVVFDGDLDHLVTPQHPDAAAISFTNVVAPSYKATTTL